jgi:hypothetical protein
MRTKMPVVQTSMEPLLAAPRILVFEQYAHAAASWVGDAGYSDGRPDLCAPSEPDVTTGAGEELPVTSASVDIVAAAFETELHAFSWQAVMLNLPSPNPPHEMFGRYVARVLEAAQAGGVAELHYDEEVTQIRPLDDGRWSLSTSTRDYDVDGLVITGPGPSARRIAGSDQAGVKDRFRDAVGYWNPKDLKQRVQLIHDWLLNGLENDSTPHVLIVGAGGAAVSVALDICKLAQAAWSQLGSDEGFALTVTFVAPQAGLFTRGDSDWEERILTDWDLWRRLSPPLRAQARDHLLSGVTFRRVLEEFQQWIDGKHGMPWKRGSWASLGGRRGYQNALSRRLTHRD